MAIRYLSFDFDGCLFNSNYIKEPHLDFTKHLGNAVLVHNRPFLDQIKIENAAFDSVYAMIGSNRQSFELDTANMGGPTTFKGSCCPAIQKVCSDLNVTFNPFLIADVTGMLPHGTSYNLIMQEIAGNTYFENPQHTHADCTMDDTKRTLLFAQVQKAAADHPNEEIIFDFFDDRNDILERHLQEFFTKYPHMIPKNVTLRLNQYAGEDVTLVASIQGTGEPYPNYCELVTHMLDNLWDLNKFAESLKSAAPVIELSIEQIEDNLENSSPLMQQATAFETEIKQSIPVIENTQAIDESELSTEKELESSNDSFALSYFTDRSSGEPRAKLAFNKRNLTQNDINKWFKGYQPPEYMEDGDQIILFINVHPDSPFKDPSLFQAIEILRHQNIELSERAIATLEGEFNSVKLEFETAKEIAHGTELETGEFVDFRLFLNGYSNAFSDMPVDYMVQYKNRAFVEDDGREKEANIGYEIYFDLVEEYNDEHAEDNGSEKEAGADIDDLSESSVDSSDADNDEFADDEALERKTSAEQPALATETTTPHQPKELDHPLNPAGNPGRNLYAFHKPVAAQKINRSPIRLPEDKLCSASSSCLIS
ncbi:hypothetical protein [Legionella sp. WA2022007384]